MAKKSFLESHYMNEQEFIDRVALKARARGFRVETNRNGQVQIDFGNKKLHAGHLASLYPKIVMPHVNIPKLIDSVAPGRPCTHKPMREIIAALR